MIPEETKTDLRHIDAHTIPESPSDLWSYVAAYLNYKVPRTKVCPNHVAPFNFLSDIFFERQRMALAYANRGGGKTLSVAILCHLKAIHHPFYSLANVAAEKQQAARCYEYIQQFSDVDNEWFSQDRIFSTQSRTKFRNGSTLEILTGSIRGCKSAHPHLVSCDEIEVMEADVLQEVLLMPQSTKEHDRILILLSTRQYASGNMYQLLEVKSKQPGWPVRIYPWCVAQGEPVMTEHGWKPIERVLCGDRVLAFDGNHFDWDEVVAARRTMKSAPIIQIVLENSKTLRVTSDHLILTNDGWIEAGRLDKDRHLCYTYGGGYNYHEQTKTISNSSLSKVWASNAWEIMRSLFWSKGTCWRKRCTTLCRMWKLYTWRTVQKVSKYRKGQTESSSLYMPYLQRLQITEQQEMQRLPHENAGRVASFPRRMRTDERTSVCTRPQDEGAQIFSRISSKDVQGQKGGNPLEQGEALDRRDEKENTGWTNRGMERRAGVSTNPNINRADCQGMARQIRHFLGKRMGHPKITFPPRYLFARTEGGDRMQWGLLALTKGGKETRPKETETLPRSQNSPTGFVGTYNPGWFSPRSTTQLVGIASIKPAGTADVYDLSVKKHHNFIANGLIVHNCLFETVEKCVLPDCDQCKEKTRVSEEGKLESWYDVCHDIDKDGMEHFPEGKCRLSDGYILLKDVWEDFITQDVSTFDSQQLCRRPGRKGLCFPTFDRPIHCNPEIVNEWKQRLHADRRRDPERRHLEIAVTMDPGWANPLGVLFQAKDKRDDLFYFDCIYRAELPDRDLVPMILEKFEKYNLPPDFPIRCDERMAKEIAELNGLGLNVSSVWLSPDERMRLLRKWLDGNYREGYPGICIDPDSCEPFCMELETLKLKLDREGNPKDEMPEKGADHLIDCAGYGFEVFGLTGGGIEIGLIRSETPPTSKIVVPTRSDWAERFVR